MKLASMPTLSEWLPSLVGHQPVEGVGDLDAVLGAPLRHVAGLAEAEPGPIDRRAVRAIVADVPVEVAAGDLHAQLVHAAAADDPVVVHRQILIGAIAILSALARRRAADADADLPVAVDAGSAPRACSSPPGSGPPCR